MEYNSNINKLISDNRGVDPVLKVGGRGTNLYVCIFMYVNFLCMYNVYVCIIFMYV